MIYTPNNFEEYEELNEIIQSKKQVKALKLKKKLDKQGFHYDMEKVFEPVTETVKEQTKATKEQSEKQIKASEKQIKAIQGQTEAIQEQTDDLKCVFKDIENLHKQDIVIIKSLANVVNSSIVQSIANLTSEKEKSQFHLIPINLDKGIFSMNDNRVQIHENMLAFLDTGKTYTLTPNLLYFITHTSFQGENLEEYDPYVIYTFLVDMNYDLKYGDK